MILFPNMFVRCFLSILQHFLLLKSTYLGYKMDDIENINSDMPALSFDAQQTHRLGLTEAWTWKIRAKSFPCFL